MAVKLATKQNLLLFSVVTVKPSLEGETDKFLDTEVKGSTHFIRNISIQNNLLLYLEIHAIIVFGNSCKYSRKCILKSIFKSLRRTYHACKRVNSQKRFASLVSKDLLYKERIYLY